MQAPGVLPGVCVKTERLTSAKVPAIVTGFQGRQTCPQSRERRNASGRDVPTLDTGLLSYTLEGERQPCASKSEWATRIYGAAGRGHLAWSSEAPNVYHTLWHYVIPGNKQLIQVKPVRGPVAERIEASGGVASHLLRNAIILVIQYHPANTAYI